MQLNCYLDGFIIFNHYIIITAKSPYSSQLQWWRDKLINCTMTILQMARWSLPSSSTNSIRNAGHPCLHNSIIYFQLLYQGPGAFLCHEKEKLWKQMVCKFINVCRHTNVCFWNRTMFVGSNSSDLVNYLGICTWIMFAGIYFWDLNTLKMVANFAK